MSIESSVAHEGRISVGRTAGGDHDPCTPLFPLSCLDDTTSPRLLLLLLLLLRLLRVLGVVWLVVLYVVPVLHLPRREEEEEDGVDGEDGRGNEENFAPLGEGLL